jgi:PPE-repeat protein
MSFKPMLEVLEDRAMPSGFDFNALPPEINSERLFAGAGAAPLLEAAPGWDVLAHLFGQNTPAIMATEAHYAEMWAQDVAALDGFGAGGMH